MNAVCRFALLLCLPLLLLHCRPAPTGGRAKLLVFAAASLTDVLQEIGSAYAAETGAPAPRFNFAGSNTLAQQLLAAPRADLFLSANEHWMDVLETAGALAPGSRIDLLSNQLVVVAHAGSPWALDHPAQLPDIPFRYLAMGDPDAVPAGRYTKTWLEGIRSGEVTLWIRVRDRVAPAPDVRAALAQVTANPDLLGIVYRTDLAAARAGVKVLYRVPRDEAPPIHYVLAQLKAAPAHAEAARFHAFLTSPTAQAIFTRHGFTVNL